jgi:hypothetical protein
MLRDPTSTRRAWLGGLLVSTAAAPLVGSFPESVAPVLDDAGPPDSGAGGEPGSVPSPGVPESDRGTLVTIYTMEVLAAFAYRALADALSPAIRDVVLRFAEHHDAHQDLAREALEAFEEALPDLPDTYTLPPAASEREILLAALTLEVQAVTAYLGLIAQTVEPQRRISVASILASKVAHTVALRQALGDMRATDVTFAQDPGAALMALRGAAAP